MNILMLEDDPAIAQGLRYSLESEGYTVTHCATVTQALDCLLYTSPSPRDTR